MSNQRNSHTPIKETTGFRGSNASRTLVTVAVGAVAGAVAALLLAPQSGADTRRGLANGAGILKDNLTDSIKSGIDKLKGKAAEMEEDMLASNKAMATNSMRGDTPASSSMGNNSINSGASTGGAHVAGSGYETKGPGYGSGSKSAL